MTQGNTVLAAVNVGMPKKLAHGGKFVDSGIVKAPIEGTVIVSANGLLGDAQADLVNHGGPDKAVCVYSTDHFPYWEERLGRELQFGAFGENFSLAGWNESDWCIGDKVQIGSALLQISQPRQPCFKLAARYETPELADWVATTGLTGFYFRVLRDGEVRAGDEAAVVEKDAAGITIREANRIMHVDKADVEGIEKLLSVEALSASWHKQLSGRLARLTAADESEGNL